MWAVETVYYTLSTTTAGTNNSYTGNCDVVVGTDPAITWNVNGNSQQTPWRIGGKAADKDNALTADRTVYSKTAMGEAITKVSLSIGAASSVTINSVTLVVSTEANGAGDEIDVVSKTSGLGADKTIDFTPTSPLTSWAKDSYYKFVFNITISSTSNKFLEFSSAVFYYDYVSSATLSSIALSGTYPTEFAKGTEFSHEGMTVTATYDDASELDVTSSATFTGYNMNTAGDQEVTVSYTENLVTKTATYNIKVIAPVVTLDLSSNTGWEFPSGSGNKTVDANTYTNNGYSITLQGSEGAGYYFDTSNLLLGKTGATLTLPSFGFKVRKILVYGTENSSASVTFNVFDGEDAASTQVTSSKVTQTFDIDAGHQDVGTVYTIKVTNNNNMRISKIEVFGNGCEAGVVTAAGWATYVTNCDMEFVDGDAFVVSEVTSTKATLESVTKVRANTAVLLKDAGAKTATVLDVTPAAVTNLLEISDGTVGSGVYVLAKPESMSAGFYKWTGGSLSSGRVYLPAPASAPDYLSFDFGDGNATSVSEELRVKSEEFATAPVYNLAGQRVANPTKGLYIVNGKKVIIK